MDQELQESTGTPSRARRKLVIAGILLVVLVAAGIAYLVGVPDRDRFRAEPPACASIEPSLPLLGYPYATRQTENNSCELIPPVGQPRYRPDAPADIIVSYAVGTDGSNAVPATLSRQEPLSGIGDEAYHWNGGLVMRVSNLVVAITVFPVHESSEQQLQAFAGDLARRLAES